MKLLRWLFAPEISTSERIPTRDSHEFWLAHFAWPSHQPTRCQPRVWIPSSEVLRWWRGKGQQR